MALAMKENCEKCGRSLTLVSDAYICSFECTFCPTCTDELAALCPNCGGELLRRPKRKPAAQGEQAETIRRLAEREWQRLLALPADDAVACQAPSSPVLCRVSSGGK